MVEGRKKALKMTSKHFQSFFFSDILFSEIFFTGHFQSFFLGFFLTGHFQSFFFFRPFFFF